MGRHGCPRCQSKQVVPFVLTGNQARALGLPRVTILGYEKCLNCGTMAERYAPPWIWGIGIVVGAALICLFFWSLANRWPYPILKLSWLGAVALFVSTLGLTRTLKRGRARSHGAALSVASTGAATTSDESALERSAGATVSPAPSQATHGLPELSANDAIVYECTFGGWYPQRGTREPLAGPGLVRVSDEAVAIGALEGESAFVVDPRHAPAMYHPTTNSYCIGVGNRRWVSFRVSAPPEPGQPILDGRLRQLLGKRFSIWTQPETSAGALGLLAVVLFLIALLIGGASLTHRKQPAAKVGGLVAIGMGLIGANVVRNARRAAARAREIGMVSG